jgi:folate-dependent phosphoribosylglycinamide formyltransferase PurN
VDVLPDDTAESLAARIHAGEHQLYPAVVRALLEADAGTLSAENQ